MAATLPVNSVWTRKTTRLCCLSSRRPLVVSSCQLVVASPLVVLSLHRPLVILTRQLVVALPLAVFLLRRPFVLSSRRLVVVSPLDAPPSRPLVISSCRLLLSRRASWLSHHHLSLSSGCTTLSSSHHAGWLLRCLSNAAAAIECHLHRPPPLNAVFIFHRRHRRRHRHWRC